MLNLEATGNFQLTVEENADSLLIILYVGYFDSGIFWHSKKKELREAQFWLPFTA